MGQITTHVLDTARGAPAAALPLSLYRITDDGRAPLTQTQTNADGRCDAPVLAADAFAVGVYELEFNVAAYFAANGLPADFLTVVTIRFTAAADSHYHVPLLLSPFGYSTYRGS